MTQWQSWTDADYDLLEREQLKGTSIPDIADLLNRTPTAVYAKIHILKKKGLSTPIRRDKETRPVFIDTRRREIRQSQGESEGTEFKIQTFRAVYESIAEYVVPEMLKLKMYESQRPLYWVIDTNCGSGFNENSRVRGTPVVAHDIFSQKLGQYTHLQYYFCDLKLTFIEDLERRIGRRSCSEHIWLDCRDNDEFITNIEKEIAGIQNESRLVTEHQTERYLARGVVTCDPNASFHKNGDGIGAPVNTLPAFLQTHPGFDIILHVNLNSHYRTRGWDQNTWTTGDHRPLPLKEVIPSMMRNFWWLGKTPSHRPHLILVGSNYKLTSMPSKLYEMNSVEGQQLMDEICTSEKNEEERNGEIEDEATKQSDSRSPQHKAWETRRANERKKSKRLKTRLGGLAALPKEPARNAPKANEKKGANEKN